MRTRLFLLTVLALGGTTLLSSCFIVDTGALVEETDGGVGLIGAETCGDVSAPVIMPGDSITIDTRGMQNDESFSLCESQWRDSSSGPDSFFRLQVADGEYWHFHIEAIDGALDPVVYVLPPNCNGVPDVCRPSRSSNRCTANSPSDEHFGVRFSQSGFWYLGIDDVTPGGGRYRVSAFRPSCGDGVAQHGEACDGDEGGQDSCTDDCHLNLPVVAAPTTSEGPVPNDDAFWAPELRVDVLNPALTIQGSVRGVCDPDVFRVRVPPGLPTADSVRVTLVDSMGLCIPSPAEPNDIRVNFTDASNLTNTPGENVGPCFQMQANTLAAGLYFVEVTGGNPDGNIMYRLKVELIP